MSTELASKNEQAELAPKGRAGLPVHDDSQFANLLDTNRFDHLYRVAQAFAASKLVPQHFQNDPASCFIGCQMAIRLGVDPLMLLQNTYIVQGRPGIEAKFAIALVNSSGLFEGPIQWKMSGEGKTRAATAWAKHKASGDLCECTVSMQLAEAEGWVGKSGSKWKTMPEQMLRYRSAAWFARLYCPERLMGMQTAEELDDTPPPKQVTNQAPGSKGLLERLSEASRNSEPDTDQDTVRTQRGHSADNADTESESPVRTPTIWQTIDAVVSAKTGCTDPDKRSKAIEQWCEKSEIDAATLTLPCEGEDAEAMVNMAQKCKLWASYLQ